MHVAATALHATVRAAILAPLTMLALGVLTIVVLTPVNLLGVVSDGAANACAHTAMLAGLPLGALMAVIVTVRGD